MGERIGVAPALAYADGQAVSAAPSSSALDPLDRQRALQRVQDYLRSMGVSEPQEVRALTEQVVERLRARATKAPIENPVEAAVAETYLLLDRWLASELGLGGDANALFAARAAVLGGGVPGWSARWAGLTATNLGDAIRAASIAPVPARSPLTMEAATINLCCHRLIPRILGALRRLVAPPEIGRDLTGGPR